MGGYSKYNKSSLSSLLDEILEESAAAPGPEIQVHNVVSEPNNPKSDKPLLNWTVTNPD